MELDLLERQPEMNCCVNLSQKRKKLNWLKSSQTLSACAWLPSQAVLVFVFVFDVLVDGLVRHVGIV